MLPAGGLWYACCPEWCWPVTEAMWASDDVANVAIWQPPFEWPTTDLVSIVLAVLGSELAAVRTRACMLVAEGSCLRHVSNKSNHRQQCCVVVMHDAGINSMEAFMATMHNAPGGFAGEPTLNKQHNSLLQAPTVSVNQVTNRQWLSPARHCPHVTYHQPLLLHPCGLQCSDGLSCCAMLFCACMTPVRVMRCTHLAWAYIV